jgi:hypothetical protein
MKMRITLQKIAAEFKNQGREESEDSSVKLTRIELLRKKPGRRDTENMI